MTDASASGAVPWPTDSTGTCASEGPASEVIGGITACPDTEDQPEETREGALDVEVPEAADVSGAKPLCSTAFAGVSAGTSGAR